MDIDHFIAELLKEQLAPGASSDQATKEIELELLQKINLGIPVATWKRYNYLKALRDSEQLDPEEHTELIRISDQIEEANAELMRCLVKLAALRKVKIDELLKVLGIHPGSNA